MMQIFLFVSFSRVNWMSVTILNTFLRREHEDDKQGILDVRLRMDNEAEIDIEIQLSEFAFAHPG